MILNSTQALQLDWMCMYDTYLLQFLAVLLVNHYSHKYLLSSTGQIFLVSLWMDHSPQKYTHPAHFQKPIIRAYTLANIHQLNFAYAPLCSK
jgi:hypothetical protein